MVQDFFHEQYGVATFKPGVLDKSPKRQRPKKEKGVAAEMELGEEIGRNID